MNWFNPFLVLVFAYLGVFVQSAYSGVRDLIGVQVDLLPPLMIYTSLTSGLPLICGVAICGGIWFDSLSGNPVGASILPLFAVGLLVYQKRGLILRDQYYAQFILGVGASILVPLGTLLLTRTAGANPLVGWLSVWEFLLMGLSGGVLTPLLFLFFGRVHRTFNYQPVAGTAFRSDREIKRGRL